MRGLITEPILHTEHWAFEMHPNSMNLDPYGTVKLLDCTLGTCTTLLEGSEGTYCSWITDPEPSAQSINLGNCVM